VVAANQCPLRFPFGLITQRTRQEADIDPDGQVCKKSQVVDQDAVKEALDNSSQESANSQMNSLGTQEVSVTREM
jgi:hypothetical protein